MVELISYYTQNSLKESFAGLSKSEEDNRNWKLKLMFKNQLEKLEAAKAA